MQAAVLRSAKRNLEFEDRPILKPGAGEILIRIRACGVCHGDLMVQNGEFSSCGFRLFPATKLSGRWKALAPASSIQNPARA